ncbi:hypothetical protein V1511DRAFT_521248 [Dipodascopsis uninucleata]
MPMQLQQRVAGPGGPGGPGAADHVAAPVQVAGPPVAGANGTVGPPEQANGASGAYAKLQAVNEQAWMSIGNIADMMGDHDMAMHAYEAVLRHNRYSISAMSAIANILRSKEQFARAVEFYQSILTFSAESGETWGALGHCYLMMDDLQKAYSAYQQALYHLRDPKEPKLWYGIGILYDRYGSLEYAEEAFTQVMEMDPKFEKANEIYFRLGIIYKQQMKHDLSLQCFKYILHNPPRPLTEIDIWFQIGHSAKEAYERVLMEDPNHAKNSSFANQDLAISYLTNWYLLGRSYEAYQQAVYRDGRNPTFWCSIGVLYYQINQYRDALDAYSRAILWYDLGTLYESCNNQLSDALDAYQRAAELDPTNTHIQTRLEQLRNPQNQQQAQQQAQQQGNGAYQSAPPVNGQMPPGQSGAPGAPPPPPPGPGGRPLTIAPPNPLNHQGPLGQQQMPPAQMGPPPPPGQAMSGPQGPHSNNMLPPQQQSQHLPQPHQPPMPDYQHHHQASQSIPSPQPQQQPPSHHGQQYQPQIHQSYHPMEVDEARHGPKRHREWEDDAGNESKKLDAGRDKDRNEETKIPGVASMYERGPASGNNTTLPPVHTSSGPLANSSGQQQQSSSQTVLPPPPSSSGMSTPSVTSVPDTSASVTVINSVPAPSPVTAGPVSPRPEASSRSDSLEEVKKEKPRSPERERASWLAKEVPQRKVQEDEDYDDEEEDENEDKEHK